MKAVAWLRLHRIVPLKSTKLTEPIQNRMLGATSHEERLIASEYRKKVNIEYTNWAVNEAINWKNDWRHPDTVHIHGDSDRMFPIKYIRPTFTIKQGGHFMIMNKAADVSRCINEILQQNQGC
ncbi:MAG TPA: alpha/beta hydrolase, partial [Ferruginibacter sp.]|nr:alpha/beta hydrolase [Ferruginibacter sp.]